MKTKKGLIVLGVAFLFLISFSVQCSAAGGSPSQADAEIFAFVCGLFFILMGIFMFRSLPSPHTRVLGMGFVILGIIFIIGIPMGWVGVIE